MSTGPGKGPGGGFMPPDPTTLSCTSVACATAQAAVVDAGNAITAKCGEIAVAKARADAMLTIVLALLGVAGALAAVLVPIIGAAATIAIFIGVALSQQPLLFWAIVIIIAIAAVFLILYAAFSIQVAVLQANLAGLRSSFTTAAHSVMMSCPNTCWGNLAAPVC
jgi:hypothetical protein